MFVYIFKRLDNHQVVMVDLWLPKESFLRYNLRCKDDEQEVGVSIPQLKKVLSWMTADPMEIHAVNKKVKLTQKRAGSNIHISSFKSWLGLL